MPIFVLFEALEFNLTNLFPRESLEIQTVDFFEFSNFSANLFSKFFDEKTYLKTCL